MSSQLIGKLKSILLYLPFFYILVCSVSDVGLEKVNMIEFFFLSLLFFLIGFFSNLLINYFFEPKNATLIFLYTLWLTVFFIIPINTTLSFLIHFFQWRIAYTFILFLIFFIGIFLLLKSGKKNFLDKLTSYLIVLFCIFSCIEIYSIASNFLYIQNTKELDASSFKNKKDFKNIYLIILDGHSRIGNLSKYTNYDGNLFKENLQKKGFFIASNSHSNYRFSVQTIYSMFQLNYVPPKCSEQNMRVAINSNKTLDLLKNRGFDCWFGDAWMKGKNLEKNRNDNLNTISDAVLSKTIFNYLYNYYLNQKYFKSTVFSREKILKEDELFSKLEEVTRLNTNNPKFVHIHSLITHYNYIVDSIGNTTNMFDNLPYSEIRKWSLHSSRKVPVRTTGSVDMDKNLILAYESSVRFADKRITSLLDRVWTQVAQNSIVIIMSDHGFRFFPGKIDEVWGESYENLCAVYYPDKDYSQLYDTITPINLMRSCLNKAIGSQFQRLPDKTDIK